MDARIKDIIRHGDSLFEKARPLLTLWQEIADNFYPERADFTTIRSMGEDFASNLTTSHPVIARRELGNAFSAMLRPSDREWFRMRLAREDREDNEAKRWLEWASGVQRRAMYDTDALMVRATKEADHDFAAFGQCAISVEMNLKKNALLYRTWHLRDVRWCEGDDGKVSEIHRNWQPSVRQLHNRFGDRISEKLKDKLEKDPYCEVKCRHVVLPAEHYTPADGKKKPKAPYVSLHIDVENGHVMSEEPSFSQIYVIPRWQTVSGSQYAYSPATVAALPDARLIQAMTLTLLEAGEKAANPPMVATQEAVRSDIAMYAGGVTWVDAEYDERLGEVLRPINQDRSGIPYGMEMREDVKRMIADAFFLNKLNMPQATGAGTAYEIGQLVQEYIRNALPLFEPMEMDYNGALCEMTFDTLLRNGAFGDLRDIPESLRGQSVEFRFESPLRDAIGKEKGQLFLQTKGILAEAVAIDPGAAAMVNAREAMRDVLTGIGAPAKWVRTEKEMEAIDMQQQQQQEAQQLLAALQQGGQAAEAIGKGGQAIQAIQ